MFKPFRFSLKQIPLFVFLLPLFFVIHGVAEYFHFIPLKNALGLFGVYLVLMLVLLIIFLLLFKDPGKAGMATFISLMIFFFFGAFHDFLKDLAPSTFLIRYSFLLPFLFAIYFLSLRVIRKKKPGLKTIRYLNILFLLLIVVDVFLIGVEVFGENKKENIANCTDCPKPDVHLILLDGYAGKQQLSEEFSFDNQSFYDSLKRIGFHVIPNSRSNYSSTVFSVASILNMEYLTLDDFTINDENLNYSFKKISNNKVVDFFKAQGYRFVNNSIFDVGGESSEARKTLLISGTELISSQTLYSRIIRDLYNNFLMRQMEGTKLYKDFVFRDLRNIELLENQLIREVKQTDSLPKFIYTHFLMPHFPYYYNEQGKLNDLKDLRYDNMKRPELYLPYLEYCNKKILSLINEIQNSSKPAAIILVSDHGYRYSPRKDLYFSSLAAVHLPGKEYSGYSDSTTNVNQFRILFNKLFKTSYPVLADTTVN